MSYTLHRSLSILLTNSLQPGVKRRWEDWEIIYYSFLIISVVVLGVLYLTKESDDFETWAREEILRRRAAREKQLPGK